MRVLSAVDSISPAIQRTRDFLFRPFNWGTYLKLGLVAIVTEGFAGNFSSSNRGGQSPGHGTADFSPLNISVWLAAIFALALVAVIVCFVYYLITRLRFAFFHCLIHNTKEIRPGWRLYRAQASRFFWMNVVVGVCFLVVVALAALPFIGGFLRLFHETQNGGQPEPALLLALVLPMIPIILLLFLAGVLADIVLRDFMLPHFALEDTTAGEAWNLVWEKIKAEKRQFISYALLRVVLPTLAMVGAFMVLAIPGLILAGSLAAVEVGLHSAFLDATGASALVGKLLMVFFGLLAFGFVVLATICIGGPVSTGIREYALVFYGGRYPALADKLYPPMPRSA